MKAIETIITAALLCSLIIAWAAFTKFCVCYLVGL